MSRENNSMLSKRGGALLLKSITLFFAGTRTAKLKRAFNEQMYRRMGEKDNKYIPKIIEAAKRDTNFSRYRLERSAFEYALKLEVLNDLAA